MVDIDMKFIISRGYMKKIVLFLLLGISLYASDAKISYNITYLMAYAEDNPHDIKSREILLKHFYAKNNTKMIMKYAQELHDLDEKDSVLAQVLNSLDMKITQDKITKVLKDFLKNKEYIRYLNLYQALVDTDKIVSKQTHIDALYCAVMSENFVLAKNILKRDDLPMSPKLSSIMEILDKKLGSVKL